MVRVKPIIVAGLGNPLMSDDGIGIRIVQILSRKKNDFPTVEFRDIGLSVHGVIHAIAHRKTAILVDCAFMGESPGVIRRFETKDVVSKHSRSPMDIHGADLFDIITLSRRLGECPSHVIIFAIEPADVSPGQSLSPDLENRLVTYCSLVAEELKRYISIT